MKPQADIYQRQLRPQSELHSDSKTVRYELEMLIGVADGFSDSYVQANVAVRNTFVESFAIHCRAIILFLFGHHRKDFLAPSSTATPKLPLPTDVLAFDFDRTWDQRCQPPAAVILDAKRQADKHVAHITIDRRALNQTGSTKESVWDLQRITTEICDIFCAFLATAPIQNFDAIELQRMRNMIAGWKNSRVPLPLSSTSSLAGAAGQSFIPRLQAKTQPTESRNLPGFNMHAKTHG